MINSQTFDKREIVNIIDLRNYLHKFSMEHFGHNVFGKSRQKDMVFERMNAMYVIHMYCKVTLEDNGKICSNGTARNHATVLHSIRTVYNERKLYKDREESINTWTNVILKYLSKDINLIAKYYALFDRVEYNLKLNEEEKLVFNHIKKIVLKELIK